jgi:hypothetical protein
MSQGINDAVPSLEGGIPTDYPLTDEANTAMNLPRAGTPLIDLYTHQGRKAPHSIVENILVNGIKLNDPLGRYRHHSKQASMTMKVEAIQSFVDDIVKLQYPDAVQLIKQENAFSASKSIQSLYNETVYWGIIKKGTELLDPRICQPEMRNAGVDKILLYRTKSSTAAAKATHQKLELLW